VNTSDYRGTPYAIQFLFRFKSNNKELLYMVPRTRSSHHG
jgi:hypothetical protein